jgi:hypothetical protein
MRLLLLFILLFVSTLAYAETAQERYIRRIDEEIIHKRKMKELDLQYKIYCKELEMQKDNINIENQNTNRGTYVSRVKDTR